MSLLVFILLASDSLTPMLITKHLISEKSFENGLRHDEDVMSSELF